MNVLVVNAGSSSLKLRLLDPDDQVIAAHDLPAPRGQHDRALAREALASLENVDAVGHRVVHGGRLFTEPVMVDELVMRRLRDLVDLAPLHLPKSLAGMDSVAEAVPDVPAIACFDTAFHARMPAAAATYALPAEWRKRWGLSRFGFHGLSHSYLSRRAAEIVGRPRTELRIVTCHLGAGASLAAVNGDHSVDTTMGFTPLEGLVMATRSGSVDPGLVLWLREHANLPSRELAEALEHRSGLLGLAGTADMRAVLRGAAAGDHDSVLALDVYLHRLRGGVAAMAAALGGLDVLVFGGGVGENSPEVRRLAAEGLGFLGVELDAKRNEPATQRPNEGSQSGPGDGEREIGLDGARVRTFVIPAREDVEIAGQVRRVLADAGERRPERVA